ncbi:MCE family protein [Gordonia jinghuaiqii]|uniref:MCE family protein n=1 Tax=Gordonia jinghuaiqii TaxID=2758710 RepID=A0A7D7LZM4_9ACTN|nr:MlaD family protein [Gordonia jinghuaiqii]MCR5978392.1 MCE family protein [Gordonia jinghuaiqii]QMT02734.1 MCE family protein [Gordonia jinghuaiqii]
MSAHRKATIFAALKVALVAAVTVALFVLVVNAMRNPVEGKAAEYSADFTDASGLHENGDVRTKGMRIGKVISVELEDRDDAPVAHVRFTMDRKYRLTESSKLAIKYQSLTGIRYLDFTPGDDPGRTVTDLSASQTIPSFDITELFNGLQPVLSTMNTAQINEFSENAIALLQGDGSGLGPMLDSAQKLAEFATDRQKVISTLTNNMARISDSMGGRSPQVIQFLEAANIPMSAAMKVLNEFEKTATTGPALVEPIERLLKALGVSPDLDVDVFIQQHFDDMTDALQSFQLMPSALAGLQFSQPGTGAPKKCSKGRAQLPTDVRVLLSGSEVVLCAQ